MRGLYVVWDAAGVPRYVGYSHNLPARVAHVYGKSHNARLNRLFREQGPLRITLMPMEEWSHPDIRRAEARLIRALGRVDMGTGTLVNGNDGDEGPFAYNPALRSAAAIKAARTKVRRKAALKAKTTLGPEGRSRAARAAAWTRKNGIAPAANPYRQPQP